MQSAQGATSAMEDLLILAPLYERPRRLPILTFLQPFLSVVFCMLGGFF